VLKTAITLLAVLSISGCELSYPEVVVINKTSPSVMIRNLSFNGCLWVQDLTYGQSTSPGRCLPGEDNIHFQKMDLTRYIQASDGGIILCSDGGDSSDGGSSDSGCLDAPVWFNYQTITVMNAGYRDYLIFEITLEDMEQDFSVPGPYGH